MTAAVLDSIRRVVAEDAAHVGTTHEVYLTKATQEAIADSLGMTRDQSRRPPSVMGLPLRTISDPTRRDCIATIRRGQVISVTNL
jgi:hypothetical protein